MKVTVAIVNYLGFPPAIGVDYGAVFIYVRMKVTLVIVDMG